MLFNSLEFAIFFPLVTLLYFSIPHKYRWSLLLLASCCFYMAFVPSYILILLFTIVVDYFAGIFIENSKDHNRKLFLTISILSNIGILAFFKYFNFINDNIRGLANFLHWNYPIEALSILLPIGLSFHIFQSLSYVIEVYRGHQKAERHFGIYALYVMFYPQLVAGPIERPQNLLFQFWQEQHFDRTRVVRGLQLMLAGFFMKVVIADRLAQIVNPVFSNPQDYSGLPLLIAAFFFSFQIFCDFAGYSNIAIGSALVMGFTLMQNFKSPYLSRSIPEFWTRWHISLSTWFKDYLYIPLGGNRVPKWRWCLNLFIVFMVSGLWHGAAWTFVIWGALHGSYQIASILTRDARAKIGTWLRLNPDSVLLKVSQILITFSLVTYAWIYFRAESLADAWYISNHLFTNVYSQLTLSGLNKVFLDMGISRIDFLFSLLLIAGLITVQAFQAKWSSLRLNEYPRPLRWSLYYAAVICILSIGIFTKQSFIYFQF